ncbi:MAG: hypothetical protein FJ405_18145, partial [Verrucomicrobia bacterium]|nr:hypothetical protein [Verrucomicrobiota bacterium]
NENPIQGANSATLALRGLRFQDAGAYDCMVTDGALAIRSAVATLTVMERAVLVQGPTPVSVPAGATAVFSASAQGSSPFIYRWRRNGTAVVNITNTSSVSILVISNVQAINAGNYSVVVANAASASPASPNAALTLVTDTDADGIPNDWEVANGLNPDSANDALRDTDGDTVNNRDEYISGTNPSDPLSYLKVTSARTSQEGVILEFHAVPNRTYSVLYRSVLGQGSWMLLKNVPSGTGARTERITDPEGTGDSRYYRLLTPAIP